MSDLKCQQFWYDGGLVSGSALTLEISDPGWLYGATVFTTVRVYGESLQHPLTRWNAHQQRLEKSIAAFGWHSPNWQRLYEGALTLINSYTVLRIALFPDGRELITGRFLPPDLEQRQQQGITAWVADAAEFRRWLPTHKTGNYLGAWLALQAAQTQDAREAILVDNEGDWAETCTGNLWGWRDGCWWTPPLPEILPGVVRSHLIKFLRSHNHTVLEQPWTPEFPQTLETLAYTNSVVELVPIHTVIRAASPLHYATGHPSLAILREGLVNSQ